MLVSRFKSLSKNGGSEHSKNGTPATFTASSRIG